MGIFRGFSKSFKSMKKNSSSNTVASIVVGIIGFLIPIVMAMEKLSGGIEVPWRTKLFEGLVLALLGAGLTKLYGIHSAIKQNRSTVFDRTRDVLAHISKLTREVQVENVHVNKIYEWDQVIQENYVKTISDINIITKNSLRTIYKGQIPISSDVFESIYIKLLRDDPNVSSYKSCAIVSNSNYFHINNITNLRNQYRSIALSKPVSIHYFIDDQRLNFYNVERQYYLLRKNIELYNLSKKIGYKINIKAGKISWFGENRELMHDFGIASDVAYAVMREDKFSDDVEKLQAKYEIDFDPENRMIWEKKFKDQADLMNEFQKQDFYYLNLPLEEVRKELVERKKKMASRKK